MDFLDWPYLATLSYCAPQNPDCGLRRGGCIHGWRLGKGAGQSTMQPTRPSPFGAVPSFLKEPRGAESVSLARLCGEEMIGVCRVGVLLICQHPYPKVQSRGPFVKNTLIVVGSLFIGAVITTNASTIGTNVCCCAALS